MSKDDLLIEPLERRHQRDGFSCGVVVLDEFLKKLALQNQRENLSRTFVLCDDASHIVGYYTLVASSLRRDSIPEDYRLPRYPIPTVLLARLAVDAKHAGGGIGKHLVSDAMKRTASISESTGVYALEVDSKNDAAKRFYLGLGFIELKDDGRHLFLPTATIKKATRDR
jgi:ribosomal protein S18 acetylase RimI-like enzyme